jgi:hypothetical protein
MIGRGFAQGANGAGARFGGYGRMGGGVVRRGFLPFGGAFGVILVLIVVAIVVFAFWKLFEKAGYHGALSLLMLIPVVNIGMLLFLALSEWPAHKELAKWRTWYASTQTPAVAVAWPVAATVTEPMVAAAEPEAPMPPVTRTPRTKS